MSVTAIVVARSGSTRLPGKALLPFAGATLVGHKVQQLKKCANVDAVVIGSDSPAILAEGERYGAIPVKRDDYHCDESHCSANEMLFDMASKVYGQVILWAHPTNPLVQPETYDRAIREYFDGLPEFDSLVSVTRVQRHSWIDGFPANFNPWQERHPLASSLAPCFYQDGAIFIQAREQMLANRYFYGSKPKLFEVDATEGADIDTPQDYLVARSIYISRQVDTPLR